MGRYAREPDNVERSAKAKGSQLRTHFKNTREVGRFVRGMTIPAATVYLEQVLKFERGIPFNRHRAGCGRHAHAKILGQPGDNVAYPVKSVKYVLDLLSNLKANAESKALDSESMVIRHVQVNEAIKMRRRTYRAHGRINPYMCSPCHVEMWATEPKEKTDKGPKPELPKSRKMLAQLRKKKVPVGGGI